MITKLGKQLRIIRIQKNELLKDMADKLNITPAYLSSIENGKRKPTKNFVDKIINIYNLNEDDGFKLLSSYYETINEITISYKSISSGKLDLGLAFARKFNELKADDVNKIISILNDRS